MSWTTANQELRRTLADDPTTKYLYRKTVFGTLDGVNKLFKTFEFRRITNFTIAPTDFTGVYVNGARVTVDIDDLASGEFQLHTAPNNTDRLEATYYIQWFNDDELNSFLTSGVQWLGLGSDFTGIPEGLRPSALKYAAADAYQSLALRNARQISETFRVEDSPDPKNRSAVQSYMDMAKGFRKEALDLRDHYYRRQGQPEAPLFASLAGTVRDVAPRR